jgi:hypothetical protein
MAARQTRPKHRPHGVLNKIRILYGNFWQAPIRKLNLTVGRALLKSARVWNSPLGEHIQDNLLWQKHHHIRKSTFIYSATKKPTVTAA